MCTPFPYRITIRLEPVDCQPINGDEMFVARCEHFPEVLVAENSRIYAYEGMIEAIERLQEAAGRRVPGSW